MDRKIGQVILHVADINAIPAESRLTIIKTLTAVFLAGSLRTPEEDLNSLLRSTGLPEVHFPD